MEAAEREGAAIPVLPVPETVKEAVHDRIIQTIPREKLFLDQTPQAFQYGILKAAYEKVGGHLIFTDEAMIAEQAGFTVGIVPGEKKNIKVTAPEDLQLAEYYLEQDGK